MKAYNFFFFSINRSLLSFLTCCLLALSIIGFSGHTSAASKQLAVQVAEEVVNVNSANVEAIASTLKGIGLKKAKAIVDWRKKNGKFTSIEQLLEIKGVGEKTLSLNKGRISL